MRNLLLQTTVFGFVLGASAAFAQNADVNVNQLNFAPVTGVNSVERNVVNHGNNSSAYVGTIETDAVAGGNEHAVNVSSGASANVSGRQVNTGTTSALNFVADNTGTQEEPFPTLDEVGDSITTSATNNGTQLTSIGVKETSNGNYNVWRYTNNTGSAVTFRAQGEEYTVEDGESIFFLTDRPNNGANTLSLDGVRATKAANSRVLEGETNSLNMITADSLSFGNNFATSDSGDVRVNLNQVNRNAVNLSSNVVVNNLVADDVNVSATAIGNNANIEGNNAEGSGVDQVNVNSGQAAINFVWNNTVSDDFNGTAVAFGNNQNVIVDESVDISPDQRNLGLQVGFNLYVDNDVVNDNTGDYLTMNGEALVAGNYQTVVSQHDVTLDVNQRNLGFQLGGNVSFENNSDLSELDFYSEVNGNVSIVYPGDWNRHDSATTVRGVQRNSGVQVSANAVVNTQVGDEVNLTSIARGNHAMYSSEDSVRVRNFRQVNTGDQLSVNVMVGSSANDVNAVSASVGNNVFLGSNTNNGSLGNLNSRTNQINRGSVTSLNVFDNNTVGNNLNLTSQAFGNSLTASGDRSMNVNTRQRNTGNVTSVNRVNQNRVVGTVRSNATAIGNSSTVNVGN